MGSTLATRSEQVAMVLMLARFACWNVYLLVQAFRRNGKTFFVCILYCAP